MIDHLSYLVDAKALLYDHSIVARALLMEQVACSHRSEIDELFVAINPRNYMGISHVLAKVDFSKSTRKSSFLNTSLRLSKGLSPSIYDIFGKPITAFNDPIHPLNNRHCLI